MKKFKLYFFILLSFSIFFSGCGKKDIGKPAKIHWDRDVCARCNMAISEKRYAFEIINPKSGKAHKFDDIGCGIMWLKEQKISWEDKAIMWVMNFKNVKWINARKAYYTTGNRSPMGYGLAAYSKATQPKDKKILDFNQAVKHIFKVEKSDTKKYK